MSRLVFLAVVATAGLVGAQFRPGAWYEQLSKPSWTPPSWLFAPVWAVLYVAIAAAGWLAWRFAGPKSSAMGAWAAQLPLNVAWSWLFFGLNRPDLALIDIAALIAAIVAFMAAVPRRAVLASWLFAPYLLWVSFAGALNLSIALQWVATQHQLP